MTAPLKTVMLPPLAIVLSIAVPPEKMYANPSLFMRFPVTVPPL